MRHSIDVERWRQVGEPAAAAMARAVESCVHCGFCLPACPTYQELGEEMDSPRGRIVLMKEALEGTLPLAAAAPYVDRCLGCLACEPACPSGVQYHRLLHPFRDLARRESGRRRRARSTAPPRHPLGAAEPGAISSALCEPRVWGDGRRRSFPPVGGRCSTGRARRRGRCRRAATLPTRVAAEGARRARVALLTGCAQQVLRPEITAADAAGAGAQRRRGGDPTRPGVLRVARDARRIAGVGARAGAAQPRRLSRATSMRS